MMKQALIIILLFCADLFAEPFDRFRITKAVGNAMSARNSMRTGQNSRVELTFPDNTVVRIGANSWFQFKPGSREAILNGGTLLFSLPRDVGGVTLRAGNLVVTSQRADFSAYDVANRNKVICLTGKATVQFAADPDQRVKLAAGEMVDVFPGATAMPLITKVSLAGIMHSSLLMGMGVLPTQAQIEKAAQRQQKAGGAPAPIPQVKATDPAPSAVATTAIAMTTQQLEMHQRAIAQAEAAQVLIDQQAIERANQQEAARIAIQQAAAKLEVERRIADQRIADQRRIILEQQGGQSGGTGQNGGKDKKDHIPPGQAKKQ